MAQHIFLLRGILGEHARSNAYVVTVPGVGYRLGVRVERKIGLYMKQSCERCSRILRHVDDARICSYECTFCPACSVALGNVCPNCSGTLVERPRRAG